VRCSDVDERGRAVSSRMDAWPSADRRDEAAEAAIAAFSRGELVVVIDDAGNAGDLVAAAGSITPERMSFVVRHTSGVVGVAVDGRRADELRLSPMTGTNTPAAPFLVSVDLRRTSTTGISARERAATARALADPAVRAEDFDRPGHVLPLRVRDGGVLEHAVPAEAGVDLARLAGLAPAAVVARIVDDDGAVPERAELEVFAKQHGLACLTVADLVRYRRRHERFLHRVAQTHLPTRFGTFQSLSYAEPHGTEHLALVLGDVAGAEPVTVRMHAECLTGDVFGSALCACGAELDESLRRITQRGTGVLVYLRGVEAHELRADPALDAPADARPYHVTAQILRDLGVHSVELLTDDPATAAGLEDFGVTVAARVSPMPHPRDHLPTLTAAAAVSEPGGR
jgi:3,4-dihydroxy-2-butanone 4-phosphate synthase